MLGMHGRDQVLEGLARGPDPRLDACRQFGFREAAGCLQFTHGVLCGRPQRGLLPQLRCQNEHSAFGGGEVHVRKPVGLLADAVARGGRIVRTPALVHDRFDVEAELAEVALVPLEHSAKGHLAAAGVPVDLFAQFAAPQAVAGVEQRDEQVQEAFCT
ncbi:hypothetical protein D9M72_323180 [compost metagenome]